MSAPVTIGAATLHLGDCQAVLPTLPPASIDAVVCDPPYGLGFMGKAWDHGVPSADVWRDVLRVLKPGGHLLAFGGTRTYHRMACAIEDAGFEIRDQIGWVFGSGFPKSLDVSKAIDKAAGVERTEIIGKSARHGGGIVGAGTSYEISPEVPDIYAPATDAARQWQGWGTALKPAFEPLVIAQKPHDFEVLAHIVGGQLCEVDSFAVTDTSWSEPLRQLGFSNTASSLRECLGGLLPMASKFTTETRIALTTGLRTLKSSLSRITRGTTIPVETPSDGPWSTALDAVSLSRSVLANCERLRVTTAGELAIDWSADEEDGQGESVRPNWRSIVVARRPLAGTLTANVQAHGTGALNIDGCRIEANGGRPHRVIDPKPEANGAVYAGRREAGGGFDGGSKAAGETTLGRWPANLIHDGSAEVVALFPADAGAAAPVRTRSGDKFRTTYGAFKGDIDEAGSTFHADSGSAARFFYCAKASKGDREDGCDHVAPIHRANGNKWTDQDYRVARGDRPPSAESGPRRNHHPTVKPTDLMRYLCRLITPPGGVVLDPFMGSGSTGRGALLEGFGFVGIEREADYFAIAQARIRAVPQQTDMFVGPSSLEIGGAA